MFACIVLAISLGVVSATPQIYQDQATWEGLCTTGTMQSPIDLASSPATVHAPIQFRKYFNGHFNKHFKGSLMNNGVTVVWNINANHQFKLHGGNKWKWQNPSIRDGPFGGVKHTHAYYLWKAEFHWGEPGVTDKGSEHTIDGRQFPLEMQMVHIEDKFVEKDGSLNLAGASGSKHGFAILSILFEIDPKKPQNQEPLSQVDDKVWGMHWPGAASGKRSLFELDLKDVEEQIVERDHNLNIRQLQYGFSQLKANENAIETREPHMKKIKLTLNVGAFIRKVTRNGKDKTMSTYWTYQGSLANPWLDLIGILLGGHCQRTATECTCSGCDAEQMEKCCGNYTPNETSMKLTFSQACAEAVTWVVFERILPIAQVQANAFSSLYSNNWRATQNMTAEHNVQHLIHNCIDCECKCV